MEYPSGTVTVKVDAKTSRVINATYDAKWTIHLSSWRRNGSASFRHKDHLQHRLLIKQNDCFEAGELLPQTCISKHIKKEGYLKWKRKFLLKLPPAMYMSPEKLLDILFGEGYELTVKKELSQPASLRATSALLLSDRRAVSRRSLFSAPCVPRIRLRFRSPTPVR